ncbi:MULTISPECIES: hypothetical protein [Rhizobium/Agrobacterium group]|uniref:hypothetical protein n=1 Tax=Rhizobium/Agrobacterium group TaxID=227290 RepID=UPI0009EC0FF3|nr:hypothetical protein [Rhizobium sp. Root483D2]
MLRLARDRLLLPVAMAALLISALAYWWLDNGPHEIFGTAMFGLLGWHLTMNRRWFLKLRSGHYDARRWVVLMIHVWLGITMAALVVTSVLISRSVLGFAQFTNSVSVIELHWFSAYWVVIIVAIHAGTHWTRVMTVAANLLRLSPSPIRSGVRRLAALLLLGFGAWSFAVLGVSTKLTFSYSLEFWDFTSAVSPFFAHWTAVMASVAVLSHYTMAGLRSLDRTRIRKTEDQT